MYTKKYRSGKWENQEAKEEKADQLTDEKKFVIPKKVKRYGKKRQKETTKQRDERMQSEEVKKRIAEKLAKMRKTISAVGAFATALKDEASEEDVNKTLHVTGIDFQIPANTKKHKTNLYKCTKQEDPDLVLRRGLSFVIKVELDRKYDVDKYDVKFVMEMDGEISNSRMTSTFMAETKKSGPLPNDRFNAQLLSINGNSIEVEIATPADAIIGEWKLSVLTMNEGEEECLEYESDMDIFLLFNPWCPEDTTYMSCTDLLNEYVLLDKGIIYRGNKYFPSGKNWRFGQYDKDILHVCFSILRKSYDYQLSTDMMKPEKVARAISSIVNSNDNRGVLEGNWSGSYADGTSPLEWNGSIKILRNFKNIGDSVKYGQCWVFSGIVTTVCRALGLPCKSITNFASAHDTDGSATIDCVYKREKNEKGEDEIVKVERLSCDSVWNFHVWNEVWMQRKDLPDGYDGWQVIDATPQETSNGKFACGPAPICAVKEGHVTIPYDTRFVFAEVNGDRNTYMMEEDGALTLTSRDSHVVGKKISTKKPDGKANSERADETLCYKYMEGTQRERNSAARAKATSSKLEGLAEQKFDIEIKVKDITEVMVGSSVTASFTVKNICDETRNIKDMITQFYSTMYTGTCKSIIKRETVPTFALGPGQEESFKVTITPDDYMAKLEHHSGMEFKVLALVKETGKAVVQTDDFRIRSPDITVEAPDEAEVGQEIEIRMHFKNPLPIPLTECKYYIDSQALGLDDKDEKENGVVPANGEWEKKVKYVVQEAPLWDDDIIVNFICKELSNIYGYTTCHVPGFMF